MSSLAIPEPPVPARPEFETDDWGPAPTQPGAETDAERRDVVTPKEGAAGAQDSQLVDGDAATHLPPGSELEQKPVVQG